MVGEYFCCCLLPGGGFFVGRVALQACKLGGCLGLLWPHHHLRLLGCNLMLCSSTTLQAAIEKRHRYGRCIDHWMHLMMGRKGCIVAKCFSKCFSLSSQVKSNHDGNQIMRFKIDDELLLKKAWPVSSKEIIQTTEQRSHNNLYWSRTMLQSLLSSISRQFYNTKRKSADLFFCSCMLCLLRGQPDPP